MAKKQEKHMDSRPPVVAVLGHVDHGKTTLLDTIRKTNVAAREHGGITQHIGAYQVSIPIKEKSKENKFITFIDTPGHEAFAAMRGRGAMVADIAILVVAAEDSVKPQTKESIEQIKSAGIPMIVALNKIDLPTALPDKVKSDLAKNGVQVEGFGGDVPIVPLSAKTGKGVRDLLDMILLVAEMKELTGNPALPFEAVVVETRLDKGKGMVATVVVKNGTLHRGDPLFEQDKQIGKVRAQFDENGVAVAGAGPSKPVEVLGFTKLPLIGSQLFSVPHTPEQKSVDVQAPLDVTDIPDFLKPIIEGEKENLNVILKTDTAGSLEAILASLNKKIVVVSCGVGSVNDADVLLAKASHAFVIGFNTKVDSNVEKLAQTEKVVVRTYTIIYELLDELAEVVAGIKEVLHIEREVGKGIVIAEFPFNGLRIAGIRVLSGRIARGDTIRVMRGDEEVAKVKIKSIRHGKEEVSKASEKMECGILFDKTVDFSLNDAIIALTL
jgi:translation initiation factor IF-2